MAIQSLSRIKRAGQELPAANLPGKTLKIEWNGLGSVSLSGNAETRVTFWVDDILQIQFTDLAGNVIGAPVDEDLSRHCTVENEVTSGKNGFDLTKHLVPGKNVLHITIKDNAECGGAQIGNSDIFLVGNYKLLQ